MEVPYTIQSMVSVQRSFGQTLAAEVGYLRTDGRDFPLQRQFTQAFDRQTGARPNPALGAPGGYYVDSSQTMLYNGLQTSVRKRFKDSYSWEVNYTLGKSDATQGGDLSAYYIAAFENNQDFWDPEFDRGPASNDIRHRLNGSFIVELPEDPAAGTGRSTASSAGGSSPASCRSDPARRCESSSHRGSTAAGPTSSPASTWCSPIGGTAATPEAALTSIRPASPGFP